MSKNTFQIKKNEILQNIQKLVKEGSEKYKNKINHSSKNHKIIMAFVAAIILLFAVFFMQKARENQNEHILTENETIEKIPFGKEDLDRALRSQILNKENRELEILKREVASLKSSVQQKNEFDLYNPDTQNIPKPLYGEKKEPVKLAGISDNPRPTTRDLLYGEFKSAPPPPEIETFNKVGGIQSDSIELIEEKPVDDPEKKTIYLPPSFVKADLLTGITARTTGTSSRDTTPLMLRIRDLAILPNALKADLKGCFVIAEGYGDLASERIITRLVTLSCIDKKGGAVIDESVDGFIVDEDGGIGLAANVTAKMGTHIARSMWAGFVGGFGKGLSDSQREFSFSDSGNVNSLISKQDVNKSLKSGLGEGISDSTKDLRSFYLKLAEQTMPVLQSGSSKDVTIVFSKGKDLSIMVKDLY